METNYKQQLLQRRDALRATAQSIARETLKQNPLNLGDTSTISNHPADVASTEFETNRQLTIVEREEGELAEIDYALSRIENGSYGVCEGCDEAIPTARLQVLPEARYCVSCEEEVERDLARAEALSAH